MPLIAVMFLGNISTSDNACARALSDFLLGTLFSASCPCDGIFCSPTLPFAMYAGRLRDICCRIRRLLRNAFPLFCRGVLYSFAYGRQCDQGLRTLSLGSYCCSALQIENFNGLVSFL